MIGFIFIPNRFTIASHSFKKCVIYQVAVVKHSHI